MITAAMFVFAIAATAAIIRYVPDAGTMNALGLHDLRKGDSECEPEWLGESAVADRPLKITEIVASHGEGVSND